MVDARIVGRKPRSLSFEAAAALPLTSLTAFETLFERLEVQRAPKQETVFIIGAAGGVGSIAIQLIKALTRHNVVATASRPETKEWCMRMGADFVIDHSKNLTEQFKDLHIGSPQFIFSLNHTERYLEQIAEIIAPQGKFALIDDPSSLDARIFKRKSVSIHWELMFTRSLYGTNDLARQGEILNEVGQLIESKKIEKTSSKSIGTMNAANLSMALQNLESGRTVGKLTLTND